MDRQKEEEQSTGSSNLLQFSRAQSSENKAIAPQAEGYEADIIHDILDEFLSEEDLADSIFIDEGDRPESSVHTPIEPKKEFNSKYELLSDLYKRMAYLKELQDRVSYYMQEIELNGLEKEL